jgi:hypothetical protein
VSTLGAPSMHSTHLAAWPFPNIGLDVPSDPEVPPSVSIAKCDPGQSLQFGINWFHSQKRTHMLGMSGDAAMFF